MTTPNTLLAAARLTPEQRKRVAETITKRPHKIADGSVFCTFPSWSDYIYWIPSFTGTPEQRSQALAVVEWLARYKDISNDKRTAVMIDVMDSDIESLLSLVLELSDE